MGKGYDLERQCVWYWKNQGIFAIRLHTRQQIKELHTADVIVFHPKLGLIFIQCKAGRRHYMSPRDKMDHLQLAHTWNGLAWLCFKEKGMKFQYLQSRTRYRPKTKITEFKK